MFFVLYFLIEPKFMHLQAFLQHLNALITMLTVFEKSNKNLCMYIFFTTFEYNFYIRKTSNASRAKIRHNQF